MALGRKKERETDMSQAIGGPPAAEERLSGQDLGQYMYITYVLVGARMYRSCTICTLG